MKIRSATARDARAIAEVHVGAWRSTYRGLMPEDHLASLRVEDREATWRAVLTDPAKRVLVAEERGDVVGFVSGGPSRWADLPCDAEAYALYLRAADQRRGAGRALMGALAAELLAAGHRGLVLWVLARNASACRFYEALDGEAVATRHDEVGGVYLEERAYAWRDLRALVALAQRP